MPRIFFATFGQGQYAGALKDKYVRLEIDDIARTPLDCHERARECMNRHFGKWSNLYNEHDFNASAFPEGMLCCLDEHGNRLFSREVK